MDPSRAGKWKGIKWEIRKETAVEKRKHGQERKEQNDKEGTAGEMNRMEEAWRDKGSKNRKEGRNKNAPRMRCSTPPASLGCF